MCGLIGYSGSEEAAPLLLQGLKCLKYRGYDSAGIATIYKAQIRYKKGVGKLPEVEARCGLSHLPGSAGIGHVRWATHGEVNETNAHPQFDCLHHIAVVHNGIVENFNELVQRFCSNQNFISQTDTEIIPHLIANYMHNGHSLADATRLAGGEIKGAFAFLAIADSEPDTIAAACNDMSLAVGLKYSGNFVASDAASLPRDCDRIIMLDSGETAVISKQGATFWDRKGREIQKKIWTPPPALMTEKHDQNHYMLMEINQQPQTIKQALEQDPTLLAEAAASILRAKQVVFTACGSSRHAALLARYLFSHIGKKLSDVVIGSEFSYFSDSLDKDSLIIAVSQSGETADVLDGVKTARATGAGVISLINRENSQLARFSDLVLPLNCGQETAVAATKSFVAEVVIFYLLSHAMSGQLDSIGGSLIQAAELMSDSLEGHRRQAETLAKSLCRSPACYFIARASNLHIATEAALKLKEIAYIPAEGMPAGEMKHGTLALIEKGTPVFVICPRDATFDATLANAAEAKSRGAYIIGVSDFQEDMFDAWIQIPRVEEHLYPLVTIVPLQLFAYYAALVHGCDPDKPRNLAKSVTVR